MRARLLSTRYLASARDDARRWPDESSSKTDSGSAPCASLSRSAGPVTAISWLRASLHPRLGQPIRERLAVERLLHRIEQRLPEALGADPSSDSSAISSAQRRMRSGWLASASRMKASRWSSPRIRAHEPRLGQRARRLERACKPGRHLPGASPRRPAPAAALEIAWPPPRSGRAGAALAKSWRQPLVHLARGNACGSSRRGSGPAAPSAARSNAARRSGVSSGPASVSRCPEHVDERPRRREHLGDGLAPARADEIVRVLPFRQQGEGRATCPASSMRQRDVDRAARRPCGPPCRRRSRAPARRPCARAGELILGQRRAERRHASAESPRATMAMTST